MVDLGLEGAGAAAAAVVDVGFIEGVVSGADSGWLCCWGVVGFASTITVDSGGSSELPLLLTEMTSISLASETESSEFRLEVVEPETGGRCGALRVPAADDEDLGDKCSVISLTSDISQSSDTCPDMLSTIYRAETRGRVLAGGGEGG